ncbi:MAG: RNA polymerase factor sigma-54 [Acidobacteriota bacterium]|nr:RNA polymerase factor sigma-54 [Acidobacteriota bacterium]
MAFLQPKLNLRISQKQILTPGLVQMVSVLALNKLELKDMINAEMVENPVLEEMESVVPLLDEVAGREEKRDRSEVSDGEVTTGEKNDPFDEIDFGSFFRDYLDSGYRSPVAEVVEKPSFENFLSNPTTLTDHLMWQLGSLHVGPELREAAELVIGNLDDDGYLTASEDELLGVARAKPEVEEPAAEEEERSAEAGAGADTDGNANLEHKSNVIPMPRPVAPIPGLTGEVLREAITLVQGLDPVGVAARDLRDCLLAQLAHQQQLLQQHSAQANGVTVALLEDCIAIARDHLKALQNKQYREVARAIGRPVESVLPAVEYIKTLDPRPGRRYNKTEPRLIEPDVAFVKNGESWVVVMNEDDVPQLRLNPTYRRLLHRDAEKEVRTYVKERYKSAIQLIKNIEQRRQTITKVCYIIIARQREFLDQGIDQLKPMMIKDVAEEVGVHPSTVSRAVANKYAHTPQGVFELRYFFSESVAGPEGGGTPLLILKRRVKKLIEDEDPARPLTDEQITRILQSQGIQVTRRTVAKYREDMRIPSTHQRRAKN